MDKTDIPGTFNAGGTLGPVSETNMARIWNKFTLLDTRLSNRAGKSNPHIRNFGVGAGPHLKRKVLVLMSGGVDSSTAAALLQAQGYAVAGVYLKFWDSQSRHSEAKPKNPEILRSAQDDGENECWAQEMRDAARVAAKLGIPFEVWDVTEDYKTRVLENFYSEYAAGRTPNPDVLCNSEIKFGVGLERALAAGYEFVATGHYARLQEITGDYKKLQEVTLMAAVDKNKDQSYFLWRLTPEQLSHAMFPIGEYTKPQVRALAAKFGLHNAQKKDSQGVCFLGKIDLKEFLSSRHTEVTPKDPVHNGTGFFTTLRCVQNDKVSGGPIVDVHGNLLGLHDGLAHFTIGQRHGTKLGGTLSVPKGHAKRGGTGPYFVIEKDMAANTLIVANAEDEPKYRTIECKIKNVKCKMEGEVHCMARVRYRAPLQSVILSRAKDPVREGTGFFTPKPLGVQNDNMVGRVVFDEPARAVAPGQSIVFYEGDRVIGGGIIDSTVLLCKVPKFATVS